jgi:hypothetical protein
MSTYVIQPGGGLCNYLRVVFSYLQHCKATGKQLIVIWRPSHHCPGFFLDYFQPIPNVEFLPANTHGRTIDYDGCSPHPEWRPEVHDNYGDLKLLPALQAEIDVFVSENGPYVAAHVRRTDHSTMAKENQAYTEDDAFTTFFAEHHPMNIYIATDNRDSQDLFVSQFQGRVKGLSLITPTHSLRQTNLKSAIKDLFLCIHATNFKGSGYSSFTDVIQAVRKMRSK